MAQKQTFKETTADGSDKDLRISPVLENGDTSISASQTDPPKLPQHSYTRKQLVEISNNSFSKLRPSCLDPIYNNASGMWDPERWFLGKRRSESPVEETKLKRVDVDRDLGSRIANKRRPSDPKERLRDEQDDIVLSPQRRSFGTGCHVSQQTAATRRPESPADSRSNESYRDPGRRIGSGRIISRDRDGRGQEFGFRTNDRRDRDRLERDEREMRYGNRSTGYGERKGGRRQHRIEEEEEPEWFSGGPTSQSDTIELHGFEDIPEEEHEEKMDVDKEESSEPKGKRRRRSSNWKKNKVMTEESDIPEEDEREGDEEKENGKNINNKSTDSGGTPSKENAKTVENKNSQEFDLNKMFEFDSMPGMFQQNGTLPEPWGGASSNAGSSGSRFSQFFRVESPVCGSTSGSRRSSLQEELGNLINGGGNEAYFAPIAREPDGNSGKHIMDMLQNAKSDNYSDDNKLKNNLQELTMSGQACNVQELEAGLKELVLGNRRNSESTSHPNGPLEQPTEEMPAFKKLMGKVQIPGAPVSNTMRDSPVRFNTSNANLLNILKNAPTEQDILAGHAKAQVINQQPNTSNQSTAYPDFLARLFQQQQQQNHENPLSKILGLQKGMNALGKREAQQNYHPGIVNGQLNRQSDLSGKMSQQQQREILASIVKQQQQQQQQLHQAAAAVAAAQMQQPAIIQQSASPPTSMLRSISPRPPSPQSGMYQQPPRIPSPLVFGQTPPLLSHAPSPIHPTQMMPNMAPIIPMNSNTLQVYNPSMIQRGPSPQELVLHTQQIMQNALIKSKLEEQKEKFRKRQELQRTRSPSVSSMSGLESSPSKVSGLSSTMAAFTPTSVMRKMQAEKEKEMGKGESMSANSLFKPLVNASGDKITLQGKSQIENNVDLEKVPRPLHGQGIMHTQLPNRGAAGQNCGRPIVKGSQGMESSMPKSGQTNLSGVQNKNFSTNFDVNKFFEQQRLMQSQGRQMNTASPMNPRPSYAIHQSPRAPAVIHPNVSHSSLNMAPTSVLRNVVHPSVNAAALRAQLNQLALLQQCNLDSQQQMPGPRYIQPVTLHHLMRGQPPMARSQPSSSLNLHGSMGLTKADSQVFSNLSTASANNNSLSIGGLTSNNSHQSSPVNSNLAKWFGNDILQQKLPDLPPVPTQKALSLEEVERHQQLKTAFWCYKYMKMQSIMTVSSRAFAAIQKVDIRQLAELPEEEIRPLLPCLVRMSLITPTDQSRQWAEMKKIILKILSGIELVNAVVALLSIDFHSLEVDVKKEQQLRQKIGSHQNESILVQSLQDGLALEFERSDAARRLRLLLSQLLYIMAQIRDSRHEFYKKPSELFDNEVYMEEVADVLCIAQAELPVLLPVHEVAEALLHVSFGPWFICCLVANTPDCFKEVCCALITNGEKQDEDSEGGRIRMRTLRMLCQMNPQQVLVIRSKTVEHCRMPGLAVALTLDYCRQGQTIEDDASSMLGDLVAFISGLLLGSDSNVRAWFAQFVRNGQKKKRENNSMLQALREELLQRLQTIVLFSLDEKKIQENKVVQACALLKLYCALKGIAGLKFNDAEINLLLQIVVSHPPPTPVGVRFVSLALSMLIACPPLISTSELEKKAVEWIQWLVREEAYFERTSGVTASFGEMLLLIAIHFHSNQTNAISDLVCSTLGMKIPIRSTNMVHMKNLFTQEIFTEQVVTAHAVKVPVTVKLNANVSGFLPVHCIHQLLRSRAFSKHRVPIKDWIYRQICNSEPPLHPVLPPLIEVYVNSIIVPGAKGQPDATNEPISEEEILAVFHNSIFTAVSSLNPAPVAMETDEECSLGSMTPQLLLLYYVLLYEDARLSNMKSIMAANRKVKKFSPNFMADLPLKYLIQQAHKQQHQFAGLFSSLLRLLITHYPHLCLIEDWLYDETQQIECVDGVFCQYVGNLVSSRFRCTRESLQEAFATCKNCPGKCVLLLEKLLSLTPKQLWPFASHFVQQFVYLLQPGVPRQVIEMCRNVWLKLNTVFPGRLWCMTVNALRINSFPFVKLKPLTQDDIVLDPLQILRCDDRVFRCAPLLGITLHMLRGFLAASRSHLQRHLLDHPMLERSGQMTSDAEREELRSGLVLAQDSAACQILLECMLPTEEEQKDDSNLSSLREVQTLICSHLHQAFIADPTLAKLVHFQGYPSELLSVTVMGIPSMHICTDFIPELLSQPQLDKQIFSILLVSHISLQYAIPKSLSIARLAVNVMSTLLGVLSSEKRSQFFYQTLPALVRLARAFPPLCEDITTLFVQLGRVCVSQYTICGNLSPAYTGKFIFKVF
uniref:Uncharacterized protein n=1 Tax=Strigamia maritima TaxID=126957 RepID=T1IXD4_STRMM